jgi:hypothetical protein
LLTFAALATARHLFRFWWHASLRVWKRNLVMVLGYGFVSAEENFCPLITNLFTARKSLQKLRKKGRKGQKKTRFK